ncbi:MAG: hypothetical protein RLZZ303_3199 [Candidatus Hydrogenedentota bacterium]
MWNKLLDASAPAQVALIRLMVGAVFFSEGIQKFLYPAFVGVGRFEKMGFDNPAFIAPFVACFEILCGALLLVGLGTRLAAVPVIVIMLVAIVTTKIPVLLGEDFLGFKVRELKYYGFWSMAHEARTDFAMLMGAVFLLISGGGRFSFDRVLTKRIDAAL